VSFATVSLLFNASLFRAAHLRCSPTPIAANGIVVCLPLYSHSPFCDISSAVGSITDAMDKAHMERPEWQLQQCSGSKAAERPRGILLVLALRCAVM
jgi:hypothetical protein